MKRDGLGEAVILGWLPQDPLDYKSSTSVFPGGILTGERVIRFGALAGFAWSMLTLSIIEGIFYVFPRTTFWYHAIDVSLPVTGILFYVAVRSFFSAPRNGLVHRASLLGIAGLVIGFSRYLTSQPLISASMSSAVQGLSKAGLFTTLNLLSLLAVSISIVGLGALFWGRFLRLVSLGIGAVASALCAGTLLFELLGGPSSASVVPSAISAVQEVIVVWFVAVSAVMLLWRKMLRIAS